MAMQQNSEWVFPYSSIAEAEANLHYRPKRSGEYLEIDEPDDLIAIIYTNPWRKVEYEHLLQGFPYRNNLSSGASELRLYKNALSTDHLPHCHSHRSRLLVIAFTEHHGVVADWMEVAPPTNEKKGARLKFSQETRDEVTDRIGSMITGLTPALVLVSRLID